MARIPLRSHPVRAARITGPPCPGTRAPGWLIFLRPSAGVPSTRRTRTMSTSRGKKIRKSQLGRKPKTLPPPPAIGPALPEGINGGALIAWDPVTQTRRWIQSGGGATGGGTVTTAGNLVFQVINDGRLLATPPIRGRNFWTSKPVCAEAWDRP